MDFIGLRLLINLMIIYRVEDLDGQGPYRSKLNTPKEEDRYITKHHPSPSWDFSNKFFGREDISPYYFGFASRISLRKWFHFFKGSLQDFYIVKYQINRYHVKFSKSHKQIMFKINFAKEISKERYAKTRERIKKS